MNTVTQNLNAVMPVLPNAAHARERACIAATTLITNLLRCVLLLMQNGIYITGFLGSNENGEDRVVVRVAASPNLHRVLPDCAWRDRRPDGELTVTTWFAHRYGVRIEWEEVTCA